MAVSLEMNWKRWIGLVAAAAALALAWAWVDGGRESIRDIVQPIPLPKVAP